MKLAIQDIEIIPRSADEAMWDAFSQALILAIAHAITGGRFVVCAQCGCATAAGCSLICGDERLPPNALPGLLRR